MIAVTLSKLQASPRRNTPAMMWACTLVLFLLPLPALQAQTFSVFYNFAGGADGEAPNGDLIEDAAGNLYGTTLYGGPSKSGTIFTISPSAHETVLYSFSGLADGQFPSAGLYRDPDGNLYGTAQQGGDPTCKCGTVFKLDTSNSLTVLHTFKGPDGSFPYSNVLTIHGSLYGTTRVGGSGCGAGCGVLFKISELGSYSVVHKFTNDAGSAPTSIIPDPAGNIYGMTAGGDHGKLFYGSIFKFDTSGNFSTLFTFTNRDQGNQPVFGKLIRDVNGNFHGATTLGGTGCLQDDCGVVFRLSATNVETIVHTFHQRAAGLGPKGGVVDLNGALYGTTAGGGGENGNPDDGVLFEIGNTGQYTVLHRFLGTDGYAPVGGPVVASDHSIYGATAYGGTGACKDFGQTGCGTIYKLIPAASVPPSE